MPRNGSGSYSLYTPGNPVVSGTTISSTWANNTLDDIATALTDSVAADGQTPMTGDLDMNGNAILFDLDGDTKIYSSAEDVLDVVINGATDFTFGVNVFNILTGSELDGNAGSTLDWNGAVDIDATSGDISGCTMAAPGAIGGGTPAAGTFSTLIANTGTVLVGGSTTQASIGNTVNINTTIVGNVGTGTDDLMTYTMPASAFSANGKTIEVIACGTLANNANAKALIFNFGTAIASSTMSISIDGRWWFHGVVSRTGSSTQDINFSLTEVPAGISSSDRAKVVTTLTATETDTNAIVVKFTATATSNNDVTQDFMMVRFLN